MFFPVASTWPSRSLRTASGSVRVLGGAVLGAAVSWGLLSQARAQASCSPGLHKNWGFAAGTPLNEAPARSSSGQITVATQGGYLHALSWEGAFLWSYSTEGGLLSGVHAVNDGRLVAITSSRQVYSWHSNGQLAWSFRSPVAPSEVVVSDPRQLVFFVSGTRLYALTARGTLSWSAELDAPATSNIAIDPAGSAWLITRDDKLHRVRTPYFHDSWTLSAAFGEQGRVAGLAPTSTLVSALGDGAVVLRSDELSYVGSDGAVRWRHSNIARAVSVADADPNHAPTLVAVDHSLRASWIDAATGQTASRIELGSLGSSGSSAADLSLAASGSRLALGDAEGSVWIYNQRGQSAHCNISFATVLQPLFDPEHRQVIAAAGDGSVAALGFDGEW